MVEYSLAKAKVEGSSPFFRLKGYFPGLSFNRDKMVVIIGVAGRRHEKLFLLLFASHILCFLDLIFFPIPVSGIELKPRQKTHSAGYCQTEKRKKLKKGEGVK